MDQPLLNFPESWVVTGCSARQLVVIHYSVEIHKFSFHFKFNLSYGSNNPYLS